MSGTVLLLVVVGLVVGLPLVWYFSAEQRAKRAMRAIPLTSIEQAADESRVRVVGTVETDTPVQAPLSGRDCVYWRVVVERKTGGNNSRWVKLVDEHEGVDFTLRDRTGIAWVETVHTHAILESDRSGGASFMRDPSPELKAFLNQRGYETEGWFGINKTLRYNEGVAEVGEEVAVVGDGAWERDPDAPARGGSGYREAQVPQRLRIRAPEDGTPLLLSDKPEVMS